jgi:hypothetical protein
MQRLVGLRKPIVMIRKWSRGDLRQPKQGVVDRGVTRLRWAGHGVRLQIVGLSLVRLGHISPGCEEVSALAAALRGGFRLEDLVAVVFFVGVMVAAAFLAGALLVEAFLAGADFAVRAAASLSWDRKLAISSRSASTSSAGAARRLVRRGQGRPAPLPYRPQSPRNAATAHDWCGWHS